MIYLQCSPPDDHPCYFYFFPPRWSGGLMSLSIRVEPTVFFLFFFLVLLLFFFSLFFFFHSPSTHAFIPSAALSRATDLWAQSTKLWLKAIYLNPQTLSRPRGHKFMNLLPELDFAICRQCLKTHTGNYGRQKWLFINSLDGLGRASVSAKHAGFSFFFFFLLGQRIWGYFVFRWWVIWLRTEVSLPPSLILPAVWPLCCGVTCRGETLRIWKHELCLLGLLSHRFHPFTIPSSFSLSSCVCLRVCVWGTESWPSCACK